MAEENNRYRYEENEENEKLKKAKSEQDSFRDALKKDLDNQKNDNKQTETKKPDEKTSEENNESRFDKKNKIKKFTDKISELEAKVQKLEEEKKALANANLMVKADELNFKKRIEAEKENTLKYANQKILEKLVNEIDLFDKVVNMPTDDPNLKNYLIGFTMINNNLKNILSEEGVKKIEVKVGDQFDPKYHHVLQTGWDDKYEENAILGELRGGYTYKDRVLCTTLVKVNKKESE